MRGSSHCVQMHWLAHPAARLGLVVDGQHDLIHARSLQGLQMQRMGVGNSSCTTVLAYHSLSFLLRTGDASR